MTTLCDGSRELELIRLALDEPRSGWTWIELRGPPRDREVAPCRGRAGADAAVQGDSSDVAFNDSGPSLRPDAAFPFCSESGVHRLDCAAANV